MSHWSYDTIQVKVRTLSLFSLPSEVRLTQVLVTRSLGVIYKPKTTLKDWSFYKCMYVGFILENMVEMESKYVAIFVISSYSNIRT